MALVLCTAADLGSLKTQKVILEKAGHVVYPAMDQLKVIDACKQWVFDVAVIADSVSPETKKAMASLIRLCCPSAKILELYSPFQERTVVDADLWLEVSTGVPEELGEKVSALATKKKARPA